MRKKGFTLIELLAVIIILAIIALVATPIILNVIEDARKSAGKSEASMIMNSINNYCATSEMKNQLDGSIDICNDDDGVTIDDVSQMVSLGNAEVLEVKYENGKVTKLKVKSNNYEFELQSDGSFTINGASQTPEEPVVPIITKIEDKVLEQFPYLNTDGSGCTLTNDNNYSYMGGCYLKGNPDNNYIWYSGFLWRIMGINADNSIKLVAEDNLSTVIFGTRNNALNYDGSFIKDWLNNYFYNNLKNKDIIADQVWCYEATTTKSSNRTVCSNDALTSASKVGLITLDEYNLAGDNTSYLYNNQSHWMLTPYDATKVWYMHYNGDSNSLMSTNNRGIRPVINILPTATITSGSGKIASNWTKDNGPYVLNENKFIDVNDNLNTATIGEYVKFANKIYRVVGIDDDGNTKLILDGFYEEPVATKYLMNFGASNTFTTDGNIGQKLNGDVLNWLVASTDSTNRDKMVRDYPFYQNKTDYGTNYTVALEQTKPTRTINSTVGLIRMSEMLSGQSSSILTAGYTSNSDMENSASYWTLTPYTNNNQIWLVYNYGNTDIVNVTNPNAIRPVIVINSSVKINGGSGIWSDPYEI